MERLRPNETALRGEWINVDGNVIGDSVSERIGQLIAIELIEVGTADDGWSTLFRDPTDGRFWELSYPLSEMHGGGPRELKCMDPDVATQKYGVR